MDNNKDYREPTDEGEDVWIRPKGVRTARGLAADPVAEKLVLFDWLPLIDERGFVIYAWLKGMAGEPGLFSTTPIGSFLGLDPLTVLDYLHWLEICRLIQRDGTTGWLGYGILEARPVTDGVLARIREAVRRDPRISDQGRFRFVSYVESWHSLYRGSDR